MATLTQTENSLVEEAKDPPSGLNSGSTATMALVDPVGWLLELVVAGVVEVKLHLVFSNKIVFNQADWYESCTTLLLPVPR